jgi:Zn-dependent peptidase ImmA (M78 family)
MFFHLFLQNQNPKKEREKSANVFPSRSLLSSKKMKERLFRRESYNKRERERSTEVFFSKIREG